MTENDFAQHITEHDAIENEIDALLDKHGVDAGCQAEILAQLLINRIEESDAVETLATCAFGIIAAVLNRALGDGVLLAPKGNC